MSGSATLPAGGMPFKARFRTTSESSTVENLYLATAMQRNVRQQIKQDSVEVKAGTSLSEAFSKKGLRGGSIKGGQTSGGFDMSQLRLRSTSVTSTDSEVSLPDRSPGLLSSSCSDSPFRRSTSSTPSNSAGLTVGKAQTLPPIPADVPSPQLGGPLNPLYGSPSSFPANPLYNTPSPTAPSPTANPMYNSPRAFQNDSNPLYNSPTKLAPAQSQYSTPSSIPVNSGPMYNTLPSRGPRSALLGSAPPMPFEGANPALNYDTPKSHAASEAPAAMQMPDSSPHTSMVSRSGSKGHRSALLKEFSQSVSEDSDSPSSSVEAPAPASLVKAPVPKPRTDRKLKEPIPEEVLAEQQEDIPPSINREAKPTLTKDESPEGDVSEEPPPIDRSHKPHFEPPKPPVVDRATKPLLATATAIQEDSSEGEDDDDDGEEEFGELPQQSDDTLHYVKLVHLQSPPPPVMRPVPKPRRVLSHEADTSVDGGTEYSMVDKERTSELHRRLSDLAAAVPSCPDEGPCVQDVAVAEQPRYVNLTHEGEVDEENDPQYYTVMKVSPDHTELLPLFIHRMDGLGH